MTTSKLAAALPVNQSNEDLTALILRITLNFIFPLFAVVAFAMVIYAGVLFMMSSGDPEKVTKARNTLLYAVIAIVVVVLSFAIVVSLNSIISKKFLT